MTLYSEVLDSPESARKFLDLNKISKEQIRTIVVIWEEDEDENRRSTEERKN